MIVVTRLDNSQVVVNADLIVLIEERPDSVMTLTTGERLLVRESAAEIVARATAFYQRINAGGAWRTAEIVRPAQGEEH